MKSILALALISGFISNTGALLLPKAIAASEIAQVPALTDTLTKPWNRPTVRLTLPTSANQIQFSGDGNRLLTDGGGEKTINLWNLTTGKTQSTFSAKAGSVFCGAALSADGQFVATLLTSTEATASPAKRKIELQVWSLKTGQTQWNVPIQDHTIQSDQPVPCQVVFSPNSRLLATSINGAANKSQAGVRLWNVPQGTLQQVTRSTMNAIDHLSFSSDSSFLGYTFEINSKSQLQLWNLRDRALKANLSAPQYADSRPGTPRHEYFGSIANFRFDLNQQDAIAYVWDGELISYLYRWQIKTGELLGTRELPLDRQDGLLAVSPDGQTYVYGGQVTGYHIGDLQTRQSLNFPQGLSLPMDQQRKVVFSPDGQQIAISYNETIMILR